MTTTKSTVQTHHLVQQALGENPVFAELLGEDWIQKNINTIHLPSVVEVASATDTSLHLSNHSAVAKAQKALFESFRTREFGGIEASTLIADPTRNPAAFAEMKAAAIQLANNVRDATGKGLIDGKIFLTTKDVRAAGVDLVSAANAYFSPDKFLGSSQAAQNLSTELAGYRSARAALDAAGVDSAWVAFDTPQKAIAYLESSIKAGRNPANTRYATSPSFAKYLEYIDDGSIDAYVRNTPAVKALPRQLLEALSKRGIGPLLAVALIVAAASPDVARAATANSAQERDSILRDAAVSTGLDIATMALGLEVAPALLVTAAGYGMYKYATDTETRELTNDYLSSVAAVIPQMATRIYNDQRIDTGDES